MRLVEARRDSAGTEEPRKQIGMEVVSTFLFHDQGLKSEIGKIYDPRGNLVSLEQVDNMSVILGPAVEEHLSLCRVEKADVVVLLFVRRSYTRISQNQVIVE